MHRVVLVSITEYRSVGRGSRKRVVKTPTTYERNDIVGAREIIRNVVGLTQGAHFPIKKTIWGVEDIPDVTVSDGVDPDSGLWYVEWNFPPGSKGNIIKYRVSVGVEEFHDAVAEHMI